MADDWNALGGSDVIAKDSNPFFRERQGSIVLSKLLSPGKSVAPADGEIMAGRRAGSEGGCAVKAMYERPAIADHWFRRGFLRRRMRFRLPAERNRPNSCSSPTLRVGAYLSWTRFEPRRPLSHQGIARRALRCRRLEYQFVAFRQAYESKELDGCW